MKLIKTYSIIIVCSVILSVFLFIVFKLVIEKKLNPYPSDIIQEYKNKTGNEFDKRPRFKVYEDLIKDNPNVMVSVPPESYLINVNYKIKNNVFPLSGVSNVLTINCNENGYYSTHLSDRYGFNNIDKEWDAKEIEYLLVGDSFIHGACVKRPDDASSVLRKISNRSVLNLGYRGNGPITQYASLKEYMPKNVKNILWFYFEENDISDIKLEIKKPRLKMYLDDKNYILNLKSKQDSINQLHKKRIEKNIIEKKLLDKYWESYYSTKKKILRFIRLNQFKRFVFYITNKEIKNNDNLALSKFEETLVAAKQLADKNGSNFYFIYLVAYHRYKSPINSHKYKENYPKIIKIVNSLGIPIIDTTIELFSKTDDPLMFFPFREYGHYNVEGYKKLSELIYKRVN